jgi:hypothetical protein
VAIHAVVKNENFCHVVSPHCGWSCGEPKVIA